MSRAFWRRIESAWMDLTGISALQRENDELSAAVAEWAGQHIERCEELKEARATIATLLKRDGDPHGPPDDGCGTAYAAATAKAAGFDPAAVDAQLGNELAKEVEARLDAEERAQKAEHERDAHARRIRSAAVRLRDLHDFDAVNDSPKRMEDHLGQVEALVGTLERERDEASSRCAEALELLRQLADHYDAWPDDGLHSQFRVLVGKARRLLSEEGQRG